MTPVDRELLVPVRYPEYETIFPTGIQFAIQERVERVQNNIKWLLCEEVDEEE